ncbi:uncharacterized protein LOC135332978 [Halichondria panicea]|uniref:uncharacterized protein LOC135332978 n=1 Tax=Halichondria panicea TaxID=6063 RepID=UPI00312BA32A
MSSTCTLGIGMASSEAHKRKTKFSKSGENREDEGKREKPEPGVLKGLMPCVLGVAGTSLLFWALFFFILPPEIFTGKLVCTKLEDPASFAGDLSTIADWQSFALELGVSDDEVNGENRIEHILRLWSKRAGVPCLEKLVRTLKKVGEEPLILKITTNFGSNYKDES